MRAAGSNTWHGLTTEREGSQLVAYVDDERFRNGLYEFRAHAEDQAGNEASTATRTDGATASLRLPARIDTRLAVGVVPVAAHGKRSRLTRDISAPFGRRVRLSGRLTNADGQPIEAASIEALERRSDGTALPIGLATTDRRGRFRYVLKPAAIAMSCSATAALGRIGSATATVPPERRGTSSIAASQSGLRNGESVLFAGRVATRPIPSGGKLLEMQAYFRGRWRTFSTLRTNDSRPLEISLPLWRYPRPRDLPLPRSTARRRRLSVHRRNLSGRAGRGARPVMPRLREPDVVRKRDRNTRALHRARRNVVRRTPRRERRRDRQQPPEPRHPKRQLC